LNISFKGSKSGVFDWEHSRVPSAACLERLYLIVAISILFATLTGMAVQQSGSRRQVDAHFRRGLSYLKIGYVGWRELFIRRVPSCDLTTYFLLTLFPVLLLAKLVRIIMAKLPFLLFRSLRLSHNSTCLCIEKCVRQSALDV